MFALALLRVNVVIALSLSAVVDGLASQLSLSETIPAFESGLGSRAKTALSYAMLGAFAVAVSPSGITGLLAEKVIAKLSSQHNEQSVASVKYSLLVFS